jgi:hypothetical protein
MRSLSRWEIEWTACEEARGHVAWAEYEDAPSYNVLVSVLFVCGSYHWRHRPSRGEGGPRIQAWIQTVVSKREKKPSGRLLEIAKSGKGKIQVPKDLLSCKNARNNYSTDNLYDSQRYELQIFNKHAIHQLYQTIS